MVSKLSRVNTVKAEFRRQQEALLTLKENVKASKEQKALKRKAAEFM